ncbi:MAG: hypothetical protein Q8P46_17320 [Hyphomicrobiales bacterium]|nr:hypothetical protein [Hyphomicrobiales bacterium]
MTKILTALTFALALGLSMASASAESIGGTVAQQDAALPVVSQGN